MIIYPTSIIILLIAICFIMIPVFRWAYSSYEETGSALAMYLVILIALVMLLIFIWFFIL